MGRQVMLLATKPNNLSLSPRSDKVKERSNSSELSSDLHTSWDVFLLLQ